MPPGVSLKVLQKSDGPAPGFETVMVEIECAPGILVAPHTHPGLESTYVLAGSGELRIKGSPPRVLQAGDAFQALPDTVHCVQIGDTGARVASTLVVRKGEPLVTPAAMTDERAEA